MGGERAESTKRAYSVAQDLLAGRESEDQLEQLSETELALGIQFCRPAGGAVDLALSARECMRAVLDARLAEGARRQSEALVNATKGLEAALRETAEASGKLTKRIGLATLVLMGVGAAIAAVGVAIALAQYQYFE